MSREIKWLDIPKYAEKGMTFNIFVAARQIGKTYGVIKYLYEQQKTIMFVRRTEKEAIKVFGRGSDLSRNPYKKYGADIGVDFETEYSDKEGLGGIYEVLSRDSKGKPLDKKFIGYITPLSVAYSLRGTDYSDVTDLVFDEFIPERMCRPLSNEGDGFLNLLTTIGGNRELLGCPPLRVWLLANTIDLNNSILNSIGVIPDIEEMVRNGQSTYTDPKRSLFIFSGTVQMIAEARSETSIAKLIGIDNPFISESVYGNFIANNFDDIKKKVDYRLYKPLFDIDNKIFCYVYKNTDDLHFLISNTPCKVDRHYNSNFPLKLRGDYFTRFRLATDTRSLYYTSQSLKFELWHIFDRTKGKVIK